jgi:hypothetical protein
LATGVLVWAAAGMVVAGPAGAVTCPVPADPIANDHTYTTTYHKTLTVTAPGLLKTDTGTQLTVDAVDSDTSSFYNGTINYTLVNGVATGGFTYVPDPGFAGEDNFTYWIQDPCGGTDFGTVTIEVLPVVAPDHYATGFNKTLSVKAPGVLANDAGYDFVGVTDWDAVSKNHGTVNGNDDGSFTYTPAHNFHGTDTFQYGDFDENDDNEYFTTVTITVGAAGAPAPAAIPSGYWMVEQTGRVHPFGQVKSYGNANTGNVTHFEPTPSHKGYWIVNSNGHVFPFGDAKSYGSANPANLAPGETVSSISATPTGKGYWLFTSIGRAITFGDAHFYGDMSHVKLDGPVVGSIGTPTGHGYYMVASDGGIFTFGDAKFRGSMGGVRLDKPVEGLVPTQNNQGYWLVASDGGIFAFGNAPFRGSMGGRSLNKPVVGMVRYGNGYLMVASDGGIFDFSNLPFLGSLGANPPADPIVGVAA